jgi:glycosyltransferase involved in cell wall biosynthesis
VARLSPDKGIDLAIRSIAILKKKGKKVGLLIRGSGQQLQYLKALASNLGVFDFVKFIGGQTQSQMVDLYNSSDLFLVASRKDLFPFSLLEAGACGLPSVTTRVGSVIDFVEDGKNGLIVSPNSAQAIAEGINRLITNDNLRKVMGKEARRRFEEHFDRRIVATRLGEVYQDLHDVACC